MSINFISAALFKFACFIVPLLSISLAIKFGHTFTRSAPLIDSLHVAETKQTTYYFIGTSRVQRCISPETLKGHLPEHNFVNLGLSNSSFLYSCKMASNLIKTGRGNRTIFIELTGMTLLPPFEYHSVLTTPDVVDVIEKHISSQFTLEDLNGLLFYLFSIHSDLRQLVLSHVNFNIQPSIGFLPGVREYSGAPEAVLTPKNVATITSISPDLMDSYRQVISQLTKEARENGTEIQFMLPLTISKPSELSIDMAVFVDLPEEAKWTYSKEFLTMMKRSEYLTDISHLNSKGAAAYSRELSNFIKTRFPTEASE